MPLLDLIIDKIHREGPLSFREFMEMALYYPGQGYYMVQKDRIGRSGDFYTSPCLTHLFGEMLAGQLEEMWRILECRPFTIVEFGAGTGLLCTDILRRLRDSPEFFSPLKYVIIEKSDWMREKERRLLAAEGLLEKVTWKGAIHELGPFTGCVLSNELVDNFSVHQVVMEDELMEVFVDYQDGFKELLRPASDELSAYLKALEIELHRGFRGEINLEAGAWIKDVSEALRQGFVITIDYGNSSSALYNRGDGTLNCFYRHQVNRDPYQRIGEQDITCHVNFSALDHWGRQYGLEYGGYSSQARFLQGLGLNRRLRELEMTRVLAGVAAEGIDAGAGTLIGHAHPGSVPAGHRQLYQLLIDMGNKFKVLIQRKGIGRCLLSGMQFSQVLA
jgi:SAM-dependent MidA family methyltransferase